MKKAWSVVVSSLMFASSAFAVEATFKARLTSDGFKVVGDEIRSNALPQLSGMKLPNQRGGALTVHYALKGITADAKFKDVKIVPKSDFLEVAVAVEDLKIDIKQMVLYERFPTPWGTVCSNLRLKAGQGLPVIAKVGFNTKVVDGKVAFEFRRIGFQNIRQTYDVNGPDRCSLPIPGGRILAGVVEEFLVHAEPLLIAAIKVKMIEAEPQINKMLTKGFNFTKELYVPEMKGVPHGKLALSGQPVGFQYDEEGVELAYHFDISRVSDLGGKGRGVVNPGEGEFANTVLASFGLNANFLNSVLAAVIPGGTTPVEVDNSVFPGIEDVLTKSFLATFLPDINEISTDSDRVRLKIQLMSTPSVNAISETQSLGVNINDMVLTFLISQNGQWHDYYAFKFKVGASLAATIDELHDFRIKLLHGVTYQYTGSWAPDYTPTNPSVNSEEFGLTVDAIIDALYEQDNLFKVELPLLPLGNEAVTIANPSVAGPFLGLELISVGADSK